MASANTRLDTLGDLVKHQANLAVRCGCGLELVIDAGRFRRYCMLRRWNEQLEALATRLRCSRCGRRTARLRGTPLVPTPADPFPPNERGWKALQHRLRN